MDKIIENAKFFTADKEQPQASALAVLDDKFAYVGDEAGFDGFEDEVVDLGGKLVMSGIFDTRVHVTFFPPDAIRHAWDGGNDAFRYIA